ncbi:hypothetical protein [Leptolyngbya sp. FACHB-261]|uniref:hypothetical protein n=1 Tax=Leptolyngbya sp. FACHB-261 TaxID=2692806 RepID=UPI00168507A4|nr:hypothetical protein [Leptolyngbya sp. FACHB-261]
MATIQGLVLDALRTEQLEPWAQQEINLLLQESPITAADLLALNTLLIALSCGQINAESGCPILKAWTAASTQSTTLKSATLAYSACSTLA